jgi:hypothetical protein
MKKYWHYLALGLILASASLATFGCSPNSLDTTQVDERRTSRSFGSTTAERQENIKTEIAK